MNIQCCSTDSHAWLVVYVMTMLLTWADGSLPAD
jgi:hypothetical protein